MDVALAEAGRHAKGISEKVVLNTIVRNQGIPSKLFN
jgi:hypothetical protein